MAHKASSFNAVYDKEHVGNLHNDNFSRTITMLSRGGLLQKCRTHSSFRPELQEISRFDPAVEDTNRVNDYDCRNKESKIHSKKNQLRGVICRSKICVERGKKFSATSLQQSAPLYVGDNETEIFGRTRVTKPFAMKKSASFQVRSSSLLIQPVRKLLNICN